MKKLAAALVLLAVLAVARLAGVGPEGPSAGGPSAAPSPDVAATVPAEPSIDDSALVRAIASRADDVQVEGAGTVIRVLADDEDGSRHQRFLVRLASGQTLLIAHNIDLAPRVAPLDEGDRVAFSGEFAWNDKGGVVHWTHHDPAGRHPAGWIRREGRLFQ